MSTDQRQVKAWMVRCDLGRHFSEHVYQSEQAAIDQKQWRDGSPNPAEIIPLVPESLLLDARAEVERVKNGSGYSMGFGEGYESGAQNIHKLIRRAERAEALAGESSRQLDLYRKAVNEIDDVIEYSPFTRHTIYAILKKLTAGLAAIGAREDERG